MSKMLYRAKEHKKVYIAGESHESIRKLSEDFCREYNIFSADYSEVSEDTEYSEDSECFEVLEYSENSEDSKGSSASGYSSTSEDSEDLEALEILKNNKGQILVKLRPHQILVMEAVSEESLNIYIMSKVELEAKILGNHYICYTDSEL